MSQKENWQSVRCRATHQIMADTKNVMDWVYSNMVTVNEIAAIVMK